jgi:hypothetical protein
MLDCIVSLAVVTAIDPSNGIDRVLAVRHSIWRDAEFMSAAFAGPRKTKRQLRRLGPPPGWQIQVERPVCAQRVVVQDLDVQANGTTRLRERNDHLRWRELHCNLGNDRQFMHHIPVRQSRFAPNN